MARLIAILVTLAGLVQPAAAQDSALESLRNGVEGRGWAGVGRLEIAGKGFCTAVLISETELLTAAHCLYDRDGTVIDLARMHFAAGYRDGRALATRDIRRTAPHPQFQYDTAEAQQAFGYDIALIELQSPIRGTQVAPFEVAPAPRRGNDVGVVSYAVEREEAPSLQEHCGVLETHAEAMILSCTVDFGASGAPVFTFGGGQARIVGVVTAKAQVGLREVAVSATAEANVTLLRAELAGRDAGRLNTAPSARVISPGQRNADIGAKFVRP